MCRCCDWIEHVFLILIIVLALFVYSSWGRWVIFAAALILLLHKFTCRSGKIESSRSVSVKKTSSKRKRR